MIKLEHIYKRKGQEIILEDITFEIKEKEYAAVYGKPGAGKTLLLKIISFLEESDAGVLEVLGFKNPSRQDQMQIQRGSYAYLFQENRLLPKKSVKTNLELSKAYDKSFSNSNLMEALEQVHLGQEYLKRKVSTLSKDEQERVAIARMLAKKSSILLLDDPAKSLSEENLTLLKDLLKTQHKMGKTILYTTSETSMFPGAERMLLPFE